MGQTPRSIELFQDTWAHNHGCIEHCTVNIFDWIAHKVV